MRQPHIKSVTAVPANPLLLALRDKLLPWATTCDENCFTLCDPDRGRWPLPRQAHPEVLSRRKPPDYLNHYPIQSRRVSVKRRVGAHEGTISSPISALWPQDSLKSCQVPEVICVLEGTAEIRIGQFMFFGAEGDFLFCPPGVPKSDGGRPHFADIRDNRRHAALLWLGPAGSGLGCSICHSQGERHFTLPSESGYIIQPRILELFNLLMHEISSDLPSRRNRPPETGAVGRHLFIALIHSLCRELEAGKILQFAHQRADETLASNSQDPIARSQDYVRSHLNENLSLDYVARHCLLSRSQFTRRFKEATGSTFANFVTDERVKEARRLLEETDWSVHSICETIGIHDSRLRALFRARGLPSPRSFRTSNPGALLPGSDK